MNRVEVRVSSIKSIEGRIFCCGMSGIVVGELRERQPITPVVLLIINEHSKILLQDLIDLLCLSV